MVIGWMVDSLKIKCWLWKDLKMKPDDVQQFYRWTP
jgi:hypothetical protein